MKTLLTILFAVSLISCGPTAYFDYDEKMDFEQCNSFSFYAIENSGLNELDQERLKETLTEQLQADGYETSEQPDFKINFYAETFQDQSGSSVGIGIGGGGGAVGGGVSGGIPVGGNQLIMSVTIEFTNALNDELFWQAVVEHRFDPNFSPEERKEFFSKTVEKALENFPPED